MSRRIRHGRRGIDLPLKNPPASTDRVIGHDASGNMHQFLASAIGSPTILPFTPNVISSGTNPSFSWSTRHGVVARLGPLAYVEIRLTWNSRSGGTGAPRILLPSSVVVSENASSAMLPVRTDNVNLPSGCTWIVAYARPGESALSLVASGANVGASVITVAHMAPGGGSIFVSGTFLTQ